MGHDSFFLQVEISIRLARIIDTRADSPMSGDYDQAQFAERLPVLPPAPLRSTNLLWQRRGSVDEPVPLIAVPNPGDRERDRPVPADAMN